MMCTSSRAEGERRSSSAPIYMYIHSRAARGLCFALCVERVKAGFRSRPCLAVPGFASKTKWHCRLRNGIVLSAERSQAEKMRACWLWNLGTFFRVSAAGLIILLSCGKSSSSQ
jgi:hypothetical protein